MQIQISFIQSTPNAKTISFKKAQLLNKLYELNDKYEKDKETARYLQGKKRGAWGRITQADIKRSEKLQNLYDKINNLKFQLESIQ